MKIKCLIILIMLSFLSLNAQEFELGKVSVKELQEKNHPKDSSASAAILYSKGRTFFDFSDSDGFTLKTEVEMRIKIYKKEGYSWANKSVRYYIGANPKEDVSFSKAIAYNLVNGKIEKTKLKSDGEFTEQENKFWELKKITMPNIKEGTVIEYKYTISSPYLTTFPDWQFQTNIPVNYSEYITSIPEYYTYNASLKGFVVPKKTVEVENKSLTINSKERSDGYVTQTTFTTDKIDYITNKTTYIEKDLPAMKDEAYVSNIDNYTSTIMHELSMSKFPNSASKLYATDWESVVKSIYGNDDFGPELSKTSYFEQDINSLIAGISNQDQKMAIIFEYVKTRMNWNNYLGYSCNDGVKTAYKQKTGNIAEINLMLTAMLKYAGLSAKPVLVSTRSNGIAFFPNRTAYNYVIAAVENNDKVILLDASDKFTKPNILPFRALNWFGRLIREDGSSIEIDLSPELISKELVMLNYNIEVNGNIKGKVTKQYTDYNASVFRQKNSLINENEYIEKLENNLKKINISDYVRTNEKDTNLPISETFSFSGSNFCDVAADKLYLSPMIFFTTEQNPFKQEEREYPVDFGFPFQNKCIINIDIPEGYIVESLPQPANFKSSENMCAFKYNAVVSGNKIQMIITQDINVSIVSPRDYPTLKDIFQRLVSKQTEKIVLKKSLK